VPLALKRYTKAVFSWSSLKMVFTTKRKISVTLDVEVLDGAQALNINVSAVAEAALKSAVAQARQQHWLKENAAAFAAQAAWHERHGHPLAKIISARSMY
jgi:antitoxin CcdA